MTEKINKRLVISGLWLLLNGGLLLHSLAVHHFMVSCQLIQCYQCQHYLKNIKCDKDLSC